MDIEKIQMMTKLAIFEKKEGREIIEISRYFKGDYVASRVFKAMLHYTLCFILVAALAVLIRLETILLNLNINFLTNAAKLFLVVYLTGLAIMMVLSAFEAASHYDHARHMGDIYTSNLERLLSYDESGDAVRYAKEEASSYMKQYFEERSAFKEDRRISEEDDWSGEASVREDDWLDGSEAPKDGWLDEPETPKDGWLDEPETPKGGWLDEPDIPKGGWLDDPDPEEIKLMSIKHRGKEE